MISSNVQLGAILFLLVVFMANALVRRRGQATQRPLNALLALPKLVSESIEANRPLHVGLGGVGIGSRETVLALAGAEFVYESARAVAVGDAPALITVSDVTMIPLARDTLRRAYQHHKHSTFLGVRWHPTSLGFAAASTALQQDDRVAGNILIGSYGAELALILGASARHKHYSIATSDRLEGQAVAFALADGYLLGEEIFAVAGYLSKNTSLISRTTTIDVLRWLVVVGLVGWFIVARITGA